MSQSSMGEPTRNDKLEDRPATGQQLAVFSSLARAVQQAAEAASAFLQVADITRCHLVLHESQASCNANYLECRKRDIINSVLVRSALRSSCSGVPYESSKQACSYPTQERPSAAPFLLQRIHRLHLP